MIISLVSMLLTGTDTTVFDSNVVSFFTKQTVVARGHE